MADLRLETDRATVRERAADVREGDRLVLEARISVDDPFGAYRRARSEIGGCYLETSGGAEGWSYFGLEPTVWVSASPGVPALDALITNLNEPSLIRGDCAVPYPGGAIGWLSYDLAREIEDVPELTDRDRDVPRIEIGVYDALVAWREPADSPVELHVTACPRVQDDPDAAYDRGRQRLQSIVHRIREGDPSVSVQTSEALPHFESECGRDAFTDRVDQVQAYIRDGDTFQANVSHRLVGPAVAHPVDVFAALRDGNPAPYSGLLEFPTADLVSASPELLLHRDGDRLETEPIAGTRPRGETAGEDQQLAAELRADGKERAEHAMLVDLERNDLGNVCEFGTVHVPEYRRIDQYSEVMHLVSTVEGRLRDDHDLTDAIRAVFPGGTITGAPKPRTMAIIDEVEDTRRGPYTGSMGIFGFDERATLNIVIRTLVRTDDSYSIRVGAGIVADSVPDREYDETLDKARALVNAVGHAVDRNVGLADEATADSDCREGSS